MPNNQENNTINQSLIPALPLERLSLIHRDIKTYHQKWDKDKVIQIADLATIENTYTALLHNLSKITSATGAGIYLYGEINDSSNYYKGIGGSITVTSLGIDFLVSSYKERRYRPEERKKDRDQFITETENLYNSYQELITLLEHLHHSDSSSELNKLIKTLKEELEKIIQKGKIKQNNQLEERLSYIFWSLEKDNSSDIKELILLNNGIKALDRWNNLSLLDKARLWPSSLLISWRTNNYWTEWKQAWEARRSEHEKVKLLTEILQRTVSEYQQGISSEEIEEGIKERMLKLEAIWLYDKLVSLGENVSQLSANVEEAVKYLQSKIDKLEKINDDKDKQAEVKEQPFTNSSNNNSSNKLLEDKDTLATGSTSQSTFRKRTISNSKENKLANREVYELVELQSKEELQTNIEQLPK